jgi:hypothetical protein
VRESQWGVDNDVVQNDKWGQMNRLDWIGERRRVGEQDRPAPSVNDTLYCSSHDDSPECAQGQVFVADTL